MLLKCKACSETTEAKAGRSKVFCSNCGDLIAEFASAVVAPTPPPSTQASGMDMAAMMGMPGFVTPDPKQMEELMKWANSMMTDAADSAFADLEEAEAKIEADYQAERKRMRQEELEDLAFDAQMDAMRRQQQRHEDALDIADLRANLSAQNAVWDEFGYNDDDEDECYCDEDDDECHCFDDDDDDDEDDIPKRKKKATKAKAKVEKKKAKNEPAKPEEVSNICPSCTGKMDINDLNNKVCIFCGYKLKKAPVKKK